MINQIQLEFYKLKRQLVFKILLLAVVGISIFSAYSDIRLLSAEHLSGSGMAGYAKAFQDIFMLFISAVFAGFFIGSDFSNKTIQAQLSQGHSRFEVLVSKAAAFFIGTTVLMLLYPITTALVHTFKYGWGEPFSFASIIYIVRVAVLGMILNIGTTSIFVLIAFWCRDIPKTICFCLAFPVLFSFLNTIARGIPVVGKLMQYTTLAQLSEIVGNRVSMAAIGTVCLSAGATVAAVISLSNYLFGRAEIK